MLKTKKPFGLTEGFLNIIKEGLFTCLSVFGQYSQPVNENQKHDGNESPVGYIAQNWKQFKS